MKCPDYGYHLTTYYNLSSILHNGLQPKIGINCKRVSDDTPPVIFFTFWDHVMMWYKKLGKEYNVVLKVRLIDIYNENNSNVQIRKYGYDWEEYTELGCFVTIDLSYISKIYRIKEGVSLVEVSSN